MSHRHAAILAALVLGLSTVVVSPATRIDGTTRALGLRAPVGLLSKAYPLGTPARTAGLSRRVRLPSPGPSRIVLGAVTSKPLVALTFDLDMTPDMAAQLRNGAVTGWLNQDALTELRATGTHATLFMTGMWAELYPGLARQLARDPNFEIANHSYSHPAFHRPCYLLGGLAPGGAAWQLSHSQEVLSRITGVTPSYFRFPGGCYDSPAVDAVHAAGMVPVKWTVNAMDAFNPNPAGVAAAVLSRVKAGSIVLMHLQGGPNAPATGSALRTIIPALRARGFQLVTVGELLRQGSALQPAGGRELVEAYQPSATPPLPPAPIPVARVALPARSVSTVHGCWRWDARRRSWIRC